MMDDDDDDSSYQLLRQVYHLSSHFDENLFDHLVVASIVVEDNAKINQSHR